MADRGSTPTGGDPADRDPHDGLPANGAAAPAADEAGASRPATGDVVGEHTGEVAVVAARRVAIGPGAVAVILGGIAAGFLVFNVATAARRTLGWALASATAAALLDPIVAVLSKHVPRLVAVLGAFVVIGAVAGGLTFGVLHDLDSQVARLKDSAPRAAERLEDRDGFVGDTATDLRLADRVTDAVDQLEEPSSGIAAGAATSVGAFFVCMVLTIFFLSYGPRMVEAGLQQVGDPRRRRRASSVIRQGFYRARTYVLGSIGLASVVGVAGGVICRLEGTPAPVALGLLAAAGSVIPGVGVVVGSVPAVLLEAGLHSPIEGVRLALCFVALQLSHAIVLRNFLAPRSLVVGPAPVVIALLVGFEIYGVGGAYYGAVLAVLGVAILDAAGGIEGDPAELDPRPSMLAHDEEDAAEAAAAAAESAAAGEDPTALVDDGVVVDDGAVTPP